MPTASDRFDTWVRNFMPEINTELEEIYFAQQSLLVDNKTTCSLRQTLLEEGRECIVAIINNNAIPDNEDSAFYLLGNVGMYMASCRRHELSKATKNGSSPLFEASSLSTRLGAIAGVAPRFMSSHLSFYNPAREGRYRSFTYLQDEIVFINYNTLGSLSYKKAANALDQASCFGVSHPLTSNLFADANLALREVLEYNEILDKQLDVNRFFYNVRPYYKSYLVGRREYRGANAGDFSSINIVDLLLGLCSMNDPFYQDIVVDKTAYMPRSEQLILQKALTQSSLMDHFLEEMQNMSGNEHYRKNLAAFLDVCAVHGHAYTFHHDQLVNKYIEKPAVNIPETQFEDLTASGPPLPVLLRSLEKLRDLRAANQRKDITTRFTDIQRLKAAL